MTNKTSLAAVVVLFAAAGHADAAEKPSGPPTKELISQGVAAYDSMDLDKAFPLFEQASRHSDLTRADRINVFKHQAFILMLQGKEILARDKVTAIYTMDPAFELPATVSPKFRRFFADVKRDMAPPPTAQPAPPSQPPHRTIEVRPAAKPPPAVQKTAPAPPDGQPNLFVRFWPSWTCFATGLALVVPGIVVGLDVKSGRDELENAPRDETGRFTTLTLEDAKALQNAADQKGVTSTILLSVGAAALVTGGVMFFVYDGAKEVTKRTTVSFGSDGTTHAVTAAWKF
ncbi:MAG: hypothetical protein HY897_17835 [Deltaproteobacteria bacterium]|nr:hypothetical protein [Deltaproteobacteria bacterium]